MVFVIAALISLAAAMHPGPRSNDHHGGFPGSSGSSDSWHNNVDVPRIHRWPVPGAPALRALLPRPRAVEVLGGAFTSGPIHNITVVEITTSVDKAWLAQTVLRTRKLMQGIGNIGGASTPPHVDRDVVYARGDAIEVRLALLADADVFPGVAIVDEHGEVGGDEAYELTLRSSVMSITGKRWDAPRARHTLVFFQQYLIL